MGNSAMNSIRSSYLAVAKFFATANNSTGYILRYGDSADNTVDENSSVFSLIQMRWMPSARVGACC